MLKSKFVWRNVVVKEVRNVPREGKSNLVFVDLVDPSTYETSGQYMYMPEDRVELPPRQGDVVDVYTKPSMYQGRASITFASIVPAAASTASKAG
ncbi:hypothetical protein A8L34_29590 [Bacillus sp. FJAT-27264]|uniref:hypothetical protein n=1 Tax=Paenibacillus sp. (strain DSM 101736 / FJAT-27264) TaxID=1850362 RepID=UPI000807B20A|nr:hypothetical protein [Bacillus sp. FJAT-27264]OBZ15170.1 hypothetical protein A8L34_29590 [Bacillus sp. FJAT-27264]